MKFNEKSEIVNANSETYVQTIVDKSIDFVCIDPPYTDNKTNVLGNHKIQTKVDIGLITREHYRVLKPNTFYAVFGQMPTILAWYNAAIEAGFKFRTEIIWCKRNSGVGNEKRINKTHESIFIFQKGNPSWHKLAAKWDDVAQELTLSGLMNIKTIFSNLSYWKGVAQGRKLKDKSDGDMKQNDDFHNKGGYKKDIRTKPTFGKDEVNLSTIWSFLPHNCANKINDKDGQIKHPTVKPIPLLERLIELCTPETLANGEKPIILDSYVGSGTTILAAIKTNREITAIELSSDYFEICKDRTIKALSLTKNEIF
jgi:DNA modification methylase